MRKAAAFATLLGAAAVAVHAAKPPKPPTPAAAAFRVSSCASTVTCRQEDPAVAGVAGSGKRGGGASDAGFFAVWAGSTADDLHGITGRRFSKTGPTAVDFAASPIPADQYDPAVTVQKAGSFVVAWSEVANGRSDVKARRFSSAGAPLSAPLAVNVDDPAAPTIPDDLLPSVAPTKDGGFVVVWAKVLTGIASSTASPQMMLRRFDAAGAPLGAQIALSQGLSTDRPAACVDTLGNINVVWESVDRFAPFEPSKYGVSMRRLSAAGVPLAGEQVVVPPTSNVPFHPSISCASNSSFVVVWHTNQPPASAGTDVVGQKYDKQGNKVGAAFVINTTTANEQRNPSIAHDATNAFVVAWEVATSSNGSKLGIFGRRYSAAGKAGPQFEVVSHDITQQSTNPAVAPTSAAGNFVVVWRNSTKAIYARRYTP